MNTRVAAESPDVLAPANEHLVQLLPPIKQRAADRARTLGSVLDVRSNALLFVDQMAAFKGYGATISLMAIPATMFSLFALFTFKDAGWLWLFLPFLLFVWLISVWMLQQDIIGYRYEPVAVCKSTGKVYAFRSLGLWWWQLGWKLWGRVPAEVQTYDWACVRGEIAQVVVFTGDIVRRESGLVFAVTESPGSNKVVARVGIGPSIGYGQNELLVERWEHIRRFMQGEGPAWRPDDVLYEPDEPTLGAALKWGLPVLEDGLVNTWRNHHPGLAFIFTFLTLAWPVFALIGLMRWLCHKVLAEPRWPADVEAALGAKIDVASTASPPAATRKRAASKRGLERT
jgi:hypothetical protein